MQYEYEMFFDDTSPVSIHGWWPIATDRIKDQSKIQEYIDKGILRRIDMKEQDAAHSLEADFHVTKEQFKAIKEADVIRLTDGQEYVKKEVAVGIMKSYTEDLRAELTRLRSELKKERARVAELKKEIERLTPIEFSNHNTDG